MAAAVRPRTTFVGCSRGVGSEAVGRGKSRVVVCMTMRRCEGRAESLVREFSGKRDVSRAVGVQAVHALAQDLAVDLIDDRLSAEAFGRQKPRFLVVHVLFEALEETNELARDFTNARVDAHHDRAKDRPLFGVIAMQEFDAHRPPGVVALEERNDDALFKVEVSLEFGSELPKHVFEHGDLRIVELARSRHADECPAQAS